MVYIFIVGCTGYERFQYQLRQWQGRVAISGGNKRCGRVEDLKFSDICDSDADDLQNLFSSSEIFVMLQSVVFMCFW